MNKTMQELINKIIDLPADWHDAGSTGKKVLEAIASNCNDLGKIHNSAETGVGRTTLLLSHISENHSVFAMDYGRSLSQTKASTLLRPGHVSFIEGPSQKMLPSFKFESKLELVLIDGPHAYPFPDLEYFFFYPHIAPNGLLILDDTQIPSIHRMFEILKADSMFDLVDRVHDTAFFRRTSAPTMDPYSDGWGAQGYNNQYYQRMVNAKSSRLGKFLNTISSSVPQSVKDSVPDPIVRIISRFM